MPSFFTKGERYGKHTKRGSATSFPAVLPRQMPFEHLHIDGIFAALVLQIVAPVPRGKHGLVCRAGATASAHPNSSAYGHRRFVNPDAAGTVQQRAVLRGANHPLDVGKLGVGPLPSLRTISRVLTRHELTHRRTGPTSHKGRNILALLLRSWANSLVM